LAVFQQLVGINTIIYFAPTTLTNVGFAKTSAIYANLIIGVVNVLMTIVAVRIVDRVGRKPMLYAGVVGMAGSLLVLGVASSVLATPHHPGDPAAVITLVCLATFIASFAATWGPVVWVMIPEVLPLSVRGTAMGVAVFFNWAANFLVAQTFPSLLSSLGPGPVFLGYAVLGILAGLFVKVFVTETKGRSLEEIETDLRHGSGRRRSHEDASPPRAVVGSPYGSPAMRRRMWANRLFATRPTGTSGISAASMIRRSGRTTVGSSWCAAAAARTCHS
jgi:MFS family permease